MYIIIWSTYNVHRIHTNILTKSIKIQDKQSTNGHNCRLISPISINEQDIKRPKPEIDNKLLRNDINIPSIVPDKPIGYIHQQDDNSRYGIGWSVGKINR